MTKYNQKVASVSTKTTTHQGGEGYTQKPEHELIGILSTGLDNTFYEKEGEREKRFATIFNQVASKNKLFAAKALVYARAVLGQRTVTHRGAVELIRHLQGDELGKKFFSKRDRKGNSGGIVYRIDDMTEILACYLAKNGADASLPNSIKKGFKDAIEHADAYALAKYQMKGKAVSLVDIVNLVHPKETAINGSIFVDKVEYTKAITGTKFANQEIVEVDGKVQVPALRALVLGILKQFDTVEDKNTAAGQKVAEAVKAGQISKDEAAVVLNDAKTDNYKELIVSKKIGYLALLRNIRNILKTNDTELLDKACELLTQKDFIIKSLVYPHQIDLALEIMLTEFSGSQLGKVASALNTAYELSIPNLGELFNEGKTATVVDVSGSMSSMIRISNNQSGHASALDKGALIGATLAKGIKSDLYVFANRCAKVKFNPLDSINTIKNQIKGGHSVGGGTSWNTIFPQLENEGKYDRVFIISDEQDSGRVETSYINYCKKFGTPYVYIINMCGYSPVVLKPSARVARLFGYSAAIYETAKSFELNPQVVIDEINKIEI